jgi:hypothetical protein
MQDGSGWGGVRNPFKSVRVLSDEDFLGGRPTGHCGPKGIDIDNSMSTFVATCEIEPLAFFDLGEILEWISLMQRNGAPRSNGFGETLYAAYERHCQEQRALEIKYELKRQESHQAIAVLKKSRSWRVTAPLRRISGGWHRGFRRDLSG